MSSPTAKELLAQADRLMRQRTPEELPVLTDLVIEEIEIPSLSERMDEVIPTRSSMRGTANPPFAAPPASSASGYGAASTTVASAPSSPPLSVRSTATLAPYAANALTPSAPLADVFAGRSRLPQEALGGVSASGGPNTQTAMASVREKFNEQLLAKLEELQHSVFSQVMQKLEIHAAGSLKTHLRQTLEPALMGIARDLAEQVAEDTATQVRQVVSDAVDAEIARLREQFAKKRF